jgi:hypothetical protein
LTRQKFTVSDYLCGAYVLRTGWHLRDKVPILRRLKWGSFPYANLRYAPGERLQWVCGNRTNDTYWSRLSCDWVGLVVRPQGMEPRKQGDVSAGHEDEWMESVELHAVSPLNKPMAGTCLSMSSVTS